MHLPGYVLKRASTAAMAELNRKLASLHLRHAEVAFLMLLATTPGITQSAAGRLIDIQRANMVPLVARLQRRGLVSRQRVDGRSQGLMLTAAGRSTLIRARRVVEASEAALLDRVPARLRPMVLPVLTALWKSSTT